MKKTNLVLAVVLSVVGLFAVNAFSWQAVGSPINVSIPAYKAYSHQFDLLVNGRVNFNYNIQGGAATIYVMTEEQLLRATSGQEPTELGRDFVMVMSGVVGSGNIISPRLGQGRYSVTIRNTGDTPITLFGDVSAEESY